MSTNIRHLVATLRARKVGSSWMARCPVHGANGGDTNPSLAIRESDGRLLVHCHAGCHQRDVVAALRARGLWESDQKSVQRRIVTTYDYCSVDGGLLYQVVRTDPKGFLQRHPDGHVGWIWKKHSQQVLYRLPELLAAPIVFVVEGEKDVETLRSHGFVATTNAGGAKAAWLPAFSETLRHKEIIIIPDNDPPGWDRAAAISRALLGVASRIVIFDLPAAVKDISDWFLCHSETELISRLECVDAI